MNCYNGYIFTGCFHLQQEQAKFAVTYLATENPRHSITSDKGSLLNFLLDLPLKRRKIFHKKSQINFALHFPDTTKNEVK